MRIGVDPATVSAVIPTRGDVDLREIVASLDAAGIGQVIVWDNAVEERDLKVFARYAAIERAHFPVIYTQDDDCLVDAERVCASYLSGLLTANMPAVRWPDYPDSALVGWGSVFDRDLPLMAWGRFMQLNPETVFEAMARQPEPFLRDCDVVFSTLTPHQKIDIGFQHLPWAERPGRLFNENPAEHREKRDRMLRIARQARDA